jgi:hypothetical protein
LWGGQFVKGKVALVSTSAGRIWCIWLIDCDAPDAVVLGGGACVPGSDGAQLVGMIDGSARGYRFA